MKYLYRYETKGIQNWILSSNKLRDLAGGSALVEALTQTARDAAQSLGAEVLQATSGAMTASFPDRDSLERFASEWPFQVALRTPGLQLVQAWVPDTANISTLFDELAAQRNLAVVTDLEANPWVLRSGRSGRPALRAAGGSKARQTTQDLTALVREWAFIETKRNADDLVVTGGHEWDDFEIELEKWQDGPVAVIHSDGSGIGQALMRTDVKNLERFSSALRDATQAAVIAALAEVHASPSNKLLARPVVSAGDDLTYIVQACDARRFSEAWLRTFERETEKRKEALGGDKLFGGAGIAIVNRGYPFANAYSQAEQLCKAAKDAVKREKLRASVLCFKRITNSLVDNVARNEVGWILPGGEEHPLENLLSAVRALPRGTLRTWLDHFQRPDGQAQARRLWLRAAEVADAQAWGRLARALEQCGADPGSGALSEATNGAALKLGPQRTTPVGSALSLRFVEKEPVVYV